LEHFDNGFGVRGSRTYKGCLERKFESLTDQMAIFDSLSEEVAGGSFGACPSQKPVILQLPIEDHLDACQTYELDTFLETLSLTASTMPQNKRRFQSIPSREQAFGTKQVF